MTALVRSPAVGDDSMFYSVAWQVAARETRLGHNRMAEDIKKAVDASRRATPTSKVTRLARPRGDLAELLTVAHPAVGRRDLVVPPSIAAQIQQVLSERRQRRTLLDHGFNSPIACCLRVHPEPVRP